MKPILSHPLRFADLSQRKAHSIRLIPDEGQLQALAERLEVDALRKVLLEVQLSPGPGGDWTLTGTLGATVVQPCRVTMEPVVTRIEEVLDRQYVADWTEPTGEEAEMDENDTREPLPATLDFGDVLEEALTLAIPAFPRAAGADDVDLTAAPPGVAPLTDEAIKPFAGLAALRAKMDDD